MTPDEITDIIKVSIWKGNIVIVYRQMRDCGEDTRSLMSSEFPRPELEAALRLLAPYFTDYCGMSRDDVEGLIVYEARFTYDKDTGAPAIKMKAKKAIAGTKELMNLTSIKLERDGLIGWTADFRQRVEDLQEEARRFICGERGQTELAFRRNEETEETNDESTD